METDNTTTQAPEQTPVTPELVRPLEGRVLAGVAQGLANRFDLPVWVSRAFFIVCAFFGGLGVALYGAGWLLIRSEDESESNAETFFKGTNNSRSWIGVGLIFLAALILLDNLTFLSGGVIWATGLLVAGVLLYTGHIPMGSRNGNESKEGVQPMTTTKTPPKLPGDASADDSPVGGSQPPTTPPTPTPPLLPPSAAKPKERSILGRLTIGFMPLGMGVLAVLDNISAIAIDAEPRHYLALAVTTLGVGLLVGAVVGRARWLILVAVIALPTLLFSPVFEFDWNSEEFDRNITPIAFVALEPMYSIDVGNLVIDLRDLPWDGQTVDLNVHVDAGNLEIYVPDGVAIVGEASVDIGRVAAPGRESAGLGNPRLVFDYAGELGLVNIDATVDIGNIEIRR